MKITRYCAFVLGLLLPFFSTGQDHTFSQFYSSPVFLNPSLAGNTECARLSLNYRNEWPSIPAAFNTYQIVYDQSLPSISSGYGVMVFRDSQSDGAFARTHIAAAYSYQVMVSENLIVNWGLQATYIQNSLQWDNLVFADQINTDGSINPSTGETEPENNRISFADFSAGMSFGWKEKYYGGFAVHHMNEPMNSFYENEISLLSRKYTFHAGAVFEYDPAIYAKKSIFVSPNLMYQQQGNFRQLNAGVYVTIKPIVAGAWFRHNFDNPDAAIILLGLQHNNFKVGYSYDYSLSGLGGTLGAAHEVSLSYNFCVYVEKRRKVRAIKCPEF